VDGLWASTSEVVVGLIVRAISFQYFQPTVCGPDPGDPPDFIPP